jgi:hypothetical protein
LIVKNIEKLEELPFVKWESSIVIQKFLSIFGLPNEENVAISNFKNPKKNLAIKKSHKKKWFLAFSFYFKKIRNSASNERITATESWKHI